MDPCNFINKAISHTPEVEIHKTKIIPFWPLSGESEAILSKMSRPGHRAGVFLWENLYPVTEISVFASEISVTGPAQPLI